MSNVTVKVSPRVGLRAVLTTTPAAATSGTPNRLDRLDDVVESSPTDGSTLVYRASDDKYIVQQITFDNVSGNLDGGIF